MERYYLLLKACNAAEHMALLMTENAAGNQVKKDTSDALIDNAIMAAVRLKDEINNILNRQEEELIKTL